MHPVRWGGPVGRGGRGEPSAQARGLLCKRRGRCSDAGFVPSILLRRTAARALRQPVVRRAAGAALRGPLSLAPRGPVAAAVTGRGAATVLAAAATNTWRERRSLSVHRSREPRRLLGDGPPAAGGLVIWRV